MTERSKQAIGNITPSLVYRDADAAIEWLVRVLGFEVRFLARNDAGRLQHCELTLEGGCIMVSHANAERGWKSPLDLGGTPQINCVFVSDVDARHAHAQAQCAEIIEALRDTPYGSRDFGVRDPEAHQWWIGTYRPGAYWES